MLVGLAEEVERVPGACAILRKVGRMRLWPFAHSAMQAATGAEQRRFEEARRMHYEAGLTKSAEVGRPFLLRPWRVKGGVVLVHGYMAAPLEVRALGEYLRRHGYAVYGVRLEGHGTAPGDLAATPWERWCASIQRGLAIVSMLSEHVFVGGFSMGAGLALLEAGRNRERVRGVFAISAPLYLRSSMVRLVPSVVRVNSLLKRIHWDRTEWEYVRNDPENPHINYTRNPLSGVEQLSYAMQAMCDALPHISAPTLIIQGSEDPVVAPSSGPAIFSRVGTKHKQLLVFERQNHGIVNGSGSEDVFDAVCRFLPWAHARSGG